VTGGSFVAIGNALIDHTYRLTNLPGPDSAAFARSSERHLGGVSANVAAAVSALGHDARLIARVGDDEAGATVRDRLDASPIDRIRLRSGPEPTSYCLVLTDPEGRRSIVGGGESALALSLSPADRGFVGAADVAFTSAYAPVGVAETLADWPPAVVYDLAGRFADLRDRGLTRAALDALLPRIDCLVTNAGAARSYLDADAPPADLAAALSDRGAPMGVVTAGGDGAHLFAGDRTWHVPAVDVDVADTTGAGDAFTAGLVHARLLEGRPLPDAGRFAAAAAAHACTAAGAHADPPTVDAVERLLDG